MRAAGVLRGNPELAQHRLQSILDDVIPSPWKCAAGIGEQEARNIRFPVVL